MIGDETSPKCVLWRPLCMRLRHVLLLPCREAAGLCPGGHSVDIKCVHPAIPQRPSIVDLARYLFCANIAKMPSLSPVLRVGATLAALLISGVLLRKVVSEYAQFAPSDEGRNPGRNLGENTGDGLFHGGFDGSSAPEPSEARRKAAEAAEVWADQDISRGPTLRPRLPLTFARQELEARKGGLQVPWADCYDSRDGRR